MRILKKKLLETSSKEGKKCFRNAHFLLLYFFFLVCAYDYLVTYTFFLSPLAAVNNNNNPFIQSSGINHTQRSFLSLSTKNDTWNVNVLSGTKLCEWMHAKMTPLNQTIIWTGFICTVAAAPNGGGSYDFNLGSNHRVYRLLSLTLAILSQSMLLIFFCVLSFIQCARIKTIY